MTSACAGNGWLTLLQKALLAMAPHAAIGLVIVPGPIEAHLFGISGLVVALAAGEKAAEGLVGLFVVACLARVVDGMESVRELHGTDP
jgi:hypothetical protein